VAKTNLGNLFLFLKNSQKNGKIIAKVFETIEAKSTVKCTTKNICQSTCQVNKKED
jgi:hypothetical protein